MPVESDADRAVFVDADEHGLAVEYWTIAGVKSEFNAIFENAFEGVDLGDMSQIATRAPRLTLRSSDLPAHGGDGDLVIVSSVRYRRIGAVEDDGTGMVQIRLEQE